MRRRGRQRANRRRRSQWRLLKVANVLDAKVRLVKDVWVLGHVVDAVGLVRARLAAQPLFRHTGRVAAEVEVEDHSLVRKVAVDVAVSVLDLGDRGAPGRGIGGVVVDVARCFMIVPPVQLDGLAGPFHGVCWTRSAVGWTGEHIKTYTHCRRRASPRHGPRWTGSRGL